MRENSNGEMATMRAFMLDKTRSSVASLAMFSAAMLLSVTQAQAHANLVGSDPAKDATISAPKLISLHFSEALEMKVSGFKLTDVDGNPVAIKTIAAADKKSLAAAPAAPLAPGLYTISWTSMGDDSHKMNGTLSFTVK
jgi:methionine-rich copper-binding protein CopC